MKHPFPFLVFAGMLGGLLVSCSPRADKANEERKESTPQTETASPGATTQTENPGEKPAVMQNEVAVLKTAEGEITIAFWPDDAPKTVENFLNLAKSGFYDGTAFHRIIEGYMIQGGDPLTKDPSQEANWGRGSADHRIKAEANDRKHEFGVISMARAQNPDSASSQFFICLGTNPKLDGNFTAFGKVIKGDDVLKKLGATPCGPGGDKVPSKPLTRVGLESVKIVPADSVK